MAKLVTVDGAGSGLDADLLDGQSSAAFAAATHTHAQSDITGLPTALSGKEPTITAGTTAQYWRGDKSWQTLPAAGIADAPNDGKMYFRKNGAWVALLTIDQIGA